MTAEAVKKIVQSASLAISSRNHRKIAGFTQINQCSLATLRVLWSIHAAIPMQNRKTPILLQPRIASVETAINHASRQ